MNLVLEFWTSGEERPAHRGSMTEVNYIDQAGGNQGRKWVALAKERDTLSIAKDGLMMGFLASDVYWWNVLSLGHKKLSFIQIPLYS